MQKAALSQGKSIFFISQYYPHFHHRQDSCLLQWSFVLTENVFTARLQITKLYSHAGLFAATGDMSQAPKSRDYSDYFLWWDLLGVLLVISSVLQHSQVNPCVVSAYPLHPFGAGNFSSSSVRWNWGVWDNHPVLLLFWEVTVEDITRFINPYVPDLLKFYNGRGLAESLFLVAHGELKYQLWCLTENKTTHG